MDISYKENQQKSYLIAPLAYKTSTIRTYKHIKINIYLALTHFKAITILYKKSVTSYLPYQPSRKEDSTVMFVNILKLLTTSPEILLPGFN